MIARLAALAALLALALPAEGGPVTQPACEGAHDARAFATGQGVLENLLFHPDGRLYVTVGGNLARFAPDGAREHVASGIGGGLALGPDGALYAGTLNAPAQSALGTGESSVARFTALDPPAWSAYASGLDMANGLAFDDAGNLYVSNDVGHSLARIPREDPAAWTAWADVYGTNGLVVRGDTVFAAVTFDQRSPLVRVPLADPAAWSVHANLSLGAVSLAPSAHAPDATAPLLAKGLDDMTLGPDDRLYLAANAAGEVLRFDFATREACVLATGLANPSSVRFARDFAGYEGTLFVTAFDGTITVVHA